MRYSLDDDDDDAADDDDIIVKLPELPGRGGICGYVYKSHTAVDSILLLSALGVSSIYHIILAL